MNDQLRYSQAFHSYSCSCTVEGCGWFAGGSAGSKADANKMAKRVLQSHLKALHGNLGSAPLRKSKAATG